MSLDKPIEASISEEKLDSIRKIEKFEIGSAQAAELVLIKLGLKPSTEITLYQWNNETADDVKKRLEECGFAVVPREVKVEEERGKNNITAQFAVAADLNTASELSRIDPSREKDHARFGELMGFPDSAIKAFGKEEEALE